MKLRNSIGILVLVLTGQAAAQDKAKPTQAEAIAAIKKLGGSVFFEQRFVDFNGSKVTDEGLVHLKGLAGLQSLFLGDTKVTAAGVKELQTAIPTCNIVR